MAQRILVVDDHPDIRENVRDYLEMRGWSVSTCGDASAAAHLLATEGADLVILDVGLPGMDGMAFCRELRRSRTETPVLMLTARDTIDDRVEGLSAGADDYLVKPFSLRELAARVETLFRRVNRGDAGRLVSGGAASGIVLDLSAMTVTRCGRPVRINPTGLKILRVLMQASPRVVGREELESKVWGAETPPSDSLRSNLYLLRQALEKPFADLAPVIVTHPGYGWSLAAEPSPAEGPARGGAQ